MKLATTCSLLVGAVLADYQSYTIPNEPKQIQWESNQHAQAFRENEMQKDYVKFQMPDDEFVPVEDLPIVFLNGIKFHRQGKQPKHNYLERFRKITRSRDGKLQCKGARTARKHHEEKHTEPEKNHVQIQHDFIGMPKNLDLVKTIFQTKYPRYNGREAPLPYDELMELPDLTNLEPTNSYERMLMDTLMMEAEVREEDEEIEEVNFPSKEYIDPVVVEEEDEEAHHSKYTDEELEEIRLKNVKKLFRSQQNVKIGCCNGLPYNSSKRCCCRRIPFDKERKFCCAINGCESFQIFDRSNKQHYKDCLSLSGLVIQEYGYRGLPNQGERFPGMMRKTSRGK